MGFLSAIFFFLISLFWIAEILSNMQIAPDLFAGQFQHCKAVIAWRLHPLIPSFVPALNVQEMLFIHLHLKLLLLLALF